MSADAYVSDMDSPVIAEIRCYICSQRVYLPRDHEECMKKYGGKYETLPLTIEVLNTD